MKWLRLILVVLVVLGLTYAISMFYVESVQKFTVSREIGYPVNKVYKQFSNLQDYSVWNEFTPKNKDLSFTYFLPYSGKGSSLHYVNKTDSTSTGDLFIRNAIPNKRLYYSLYRDRDAKPFKIRVDFKALGGGRTKMIWQVETPPRTFLGKSINLLAEGHFNSDIDNSLQNLVHILSQKVDKEILLKNIQYGLIQDENHQSETLVGLNVTVSNREKGSFVNSVEMNYNKLFVFLTQDLKKKEDEFGDIQIMTLDTNPFSKEISYYIGARVLGKFDVPDSNFVFKDSNSGDFLVSYYTGPFDQGYKTIVNLLKDAKERKLIIGGLTEIFVQPPEPDKDVVIKYMLQVHEPPPENPIP